MNTAGHDWTVLLEGLRRGDDEAYRRLWNEYGAMLERLAERRLGEGIRRRTGPDDVVQSVCRTFFRRAQGGEFQLPDSESLWRLLCAITLTKVREQTRFHLRQKRGLQQEQHLESVAAGDSAATPEIAGRDLSPEDIAEFSDQFERLVSSLDDEERQLLDLKLQQHTNEEIAIQLQCSERTVRRLLNRVRARLQWEFGVE